MIVPTEQNSKPASLLNNKLYNTLKTTALIVLPASGAAYFGLASIWGLPNAEQVVGTITVVDTFLGVILGLSTSSYNKSGAKYDGSFMIENNEDGSFLRLQNVPSAAVLTQNEITLKINRQ